MKPPIEAALFALILNTRHATSYETSWMRCVAGDFKSLVSLARILTRPRNPARNCEITTFLAAFLSPTKAVVEKSGNANTVT